MKRIFFLLIVLQTISILVSAQENELAPVPSAEEGIDSVRRNKFLIYPGFGVGLVRNALSPSFHINIGYKHANRYEANVNTSSYFFFEKGSDGKYNINRNTFLNAEFILNFSPLNNSLKSWNGFGFGYLIEARGGYITEPSFQLYYKRKFRFFSVMPAIIFDDNFKDVWPSITIRL